MLRVGGRTPGQDSGIGRRPVVQRVERPGHQTRPEDRGTGPTNRSTGKNARAGRAGPGAKSEDPRTGPAEDPGTGAEVGRNATNGRGCATEGDCRGASRTDASDAARRGHRQP